jgi:hypothetical protein
MGDWTNSQAQVQKYKAANDHEAMLKYLEKQMKSISKVRDDMLNTIDNGEKLVESLISNHIKED